MKKDSLLKMKDLPATEEMLAVAREDVPVKVGSGWNTSYRCRYSGFVRSAVEGGILKVTLYDPDAMRLGGTLPVYEIFMEKEKQQFLTYDRAHDKWRTAKIDYLEWQAKGSNNVWISAVDDAQIRQYLVSDEKNVYRATMIWRTRSSPWERTGYFYGRSQEGALPPAEIFWMPFDGCPPPFPWRICEKVWFRLSRMRGRSSKQQDIWPTCP